jgi:hypothetical protein
VIVLQKLKLILNLTFDLHQSMKEKELSRILWKMII